MIHVTAALRKKISAHNAIITRRHLRIYFCLMTNALKSVLLDIIKTLRLMFVKKLNFKWEILELFT